MYNLSNLEPKFKNYLSTGNISAVTIRNYLSDIRHFIGWFISKANIDRKSSLVEILKTITGSQIEHYKQDQLNSKLPYKTINRRLSAIRQFFNFYQDENYINLNPARLIKNISLLKKPIRIDYSHSESPSSPDKIFTDVHKSTKTFPIVNYRGAHLRGILLILLIIPLIIPLIIYFANIFLKNYYRVPIVYAHPSSKRYLAINGKLTDNLGNPITNKTDVTFNLYKTPVGGKPIYSSNCIGENSSVKPDLNGNIKILIGSDCDAESLPTSLFNENPNIYLGIKISSDREMQPRQHIPNVGYSQRSDTLQGLSLGTEITTIPFINNNGDLLINTSNPGVRSIYESSNFILSSAESITVQSANTGDVILQATESGTIKLRTGGFSDYYTRLFINDNGHVGIGTLFPNYSLEVNGDIKITDGNKLILSSSSIDPIGVNGAIYFNTLLNTIRCYQNGAWSNCVGDSDILNKKIGGTSADNNINHLIYDGNLKKEINDEFNLKIEIESAKILQQVNSLVHTISKNINTIYLESENALIKNSLTAKNFVSENIEGLTSNLQHLTSNIINVREKITSPVIETEELVASGRARIGRVETNEIKAGPGGLILDLNNNSQDRTSEVGKPPDSIGGGKTSEVYENDNKGPLAKLIIRGLEGKTAATIDSLGNATFSGQLAASSVISNQLSVNSDATVSGTLTAENISGNQLDIRGNLSASEATLSGKLIAKEIEAGNINSIQESVVSNQQELSKLNTDNRQLTTNVNDIQKLLAEIKNQPLSNPEYYQKLDSYNQSESVEISQSQLKSDDDLTDFNGFQPILTDLTVTGSSNLYNLFVTGSGSIGGLLIENNSILSLAWDLKLSALSTIKLFEDAVIIAKDGTLTTKGTIIAQGGIKTSKIEPINAGEKVSINNLAINNLAIENKFLEANSQSAIIAASDNFSQNGIFAPAIETKTAAAGKGIIPQNSNEVIIYNDNIKEDSLVYLTPTSTSPTNSLLTVVKKESCNSAIEQFNNETISQCKKYFKVALDKPADSPILFNWLIIN